MTSSSRSPVTRSKHPTCESLTRPKARRYLSSTRTRPNRAESSFELTTSSALTRSHKALIGTTVSLVAPSHPDSSADENSG